MFVLFVHFRQRKHVYCWTWDFGAQKAIYEFYL